MRILYLSPAYVPSRRASSVHVMKMCAALARAGHRVSLVTKLCEGRLEPGVEDDHRFYGVEPIFEILKLPRPDVRGGGLVFLWHLRRLLRRARTDLVYGRDPVGTWMAVRVGHPVLFEAHGLPAGPLGRALHRRLVGSPSLRRLVVISEALRQLTAERGLLPPATDCLVAHDGADPPRREAAPAFGAQGGALQVGYVGHLYPGRGIDLILDLAARLPEAGFHLIGGSREDLATWSRRATPPNVVFHGFVPPGELPSHYAALDVLLMPYERRVGVASGRSDTASWMSPMKMFEYMAAGRAIVSSDLPVLREVLRHGENALLVEPGRPDALRLMNLHQAKGLEGTVVILADPTNRRVFRPDVHLSRAEDGSAEGFLRVTEPSSGRRPPEDLARPMGWVDREALEARFEEAEEVRLLYVAVTRA
ncbi:MAG: glycosyltransferase, partial [Thermoanaerobaculia bacterium]|nr:glycosyltransferase [Thermoanaerobaculia bacterium]